MNATTGLLLQVMRDQANCRLLMRLTWLALLCAVAAGFLFWLRGDPLAAIVVGGVLVGLGYLWAGAVLKSALQQSRPVYTCLVPQLRGRLMRLIAALYLLCALAAALAVQLVFNKFAGYALTLAVLFSVYVLFAQRYYVLAFLPSVIVVGSLSLQNRPLHALTAEAIRLGEPLAAGLGLLVALALFAWALQVLFPRGGDRHWAWLKCYNERQARLSGRRPGGTANVPRWLAWLRLPYLVSLRRDVRGNAKPGRMMMHALGTPAYDGGALIYAVAATAIMLLVGRYIVAKGDAHLALMTCSMMQGCLMLSSLMFASAAAASATRRAAEQRLYRLTPGAPSAADFNQVLFGTLLLRFLRLWAVLLAGVLLIDLVCLGQLRGVGYVLAMLMLPSAALLMRNYALMPAHSRGTLAVVITIPVVGASIVTTVLDWNHGDIAWFWIGTALGLASAIGLHLRWRQVVALPPVLPAGRLLA